MWGKSIWDIGTLHNCLCFKLRSMTQDLILNGRRSVSLKGDGYVILEQDVAILSHST